MRGRDGYMWQLAVVIVVIVVCLISGGSGH